MGLCVPSNKTLQAPLDLDSMTVVSDRRMLSKLHAILDNVTYPLPAVMVIHMSRFSARLRPSKCTPEPEPELDIFAWGDTEVAKVVFKGAH